MLKLLIVDDEAIEREGLQLIIERSLPGMFDIYESDHGRGAIEQSDKLSPDILIIDIKMPGMSGLDAIREVRKRHLTMKIVLMTAYDFFDYAKQAISLGVSEYVMKPAERQAFVDLLRRLGMEIMQERTVREQQLVTIDTISMLLPAAETELALMLMNDHVPGFAMEPLFHQLAPSYHCGYAMTCVISPDSLNISKCIEKITHLAKAHATAIIGPFIGGRLTLFVVYDHLLSYAEYRQSATDLAKRLLNKMKSDLGADTTIGVGTLEEQLDRLSESYVSSFIAASHVGSSRFCFHDQIRPSTETNGSSMADFRENRMNPGMKVQAERFDGAKNQVESAKKYIEVHYMKEITLEQAARQGNLSPYYFSKLFKQETGDTFIDYVTKLRIDKAKRMMTDPQLTLKEICFGVGYNDPAYFTRVFKKLTGSTPSEYRALLRETPLQDNKVQE
jgi:two-component system response regulator YesN